MRIVPGDPASVSSLGSDLSRRGGRLSALRDDLARVRDELADWSGPSADAFGQSLAAQMAAVDDMAVALAACAQALQDYAVELQQARAAATEAEDWCERTGLTIDEGLVVTLPWGPRALEQAQALSELVPQGQRHVDLAREQAEDAAIRLQRGTVEHVRRLESAGRSATAAVQSAQYQVQLARS